MEDKQKKLNLRSVEMTLIGYKPGSKGYWLWNSTIRSIVLSRNVTFDERSFPYKEIGQALVLPLQPTISDGSITIQYNLPLTSDNGPELHIPDPPVLPVTPAQHSTLQ
jgi:hypothetical protein